MKVTIGNLIDQLSIVNIKIWMAEDVKRDPNATDADIAKATRTTNIAKGETQKLYKQGESKMYGK
jgi:hypothetical protein